MPAHSIRHPPRHKTGQNVNFLTPHIEYMPDPNPDVELWGELGIVRITERNAGRDRLRFVGWLVGPPIPTSGYGGWSRVARPRRKALTEWVGRDSVSVTIDFLCDARDEGRGDWVEARCRDLDRLAGIGAGGEPPLCDLESNPKNLMPYGEGRTPSIEWFVDALTWDKDSIIYNQSGNRLRAGGTVVMTQFVDDANLSPAERMRGEGERDSKKPKFYVVKDGDTLQKIAAKKEIYGDKDKWRKIAKANDIRDPRKLKIGERLRIPRGDGDKDKNKDDSGGGKGKGKSKG